MECGRSRAKAHISNLRLAIGKLSASLENDDKLIRKTPNSPLNERMDRMGVAELLHQKKKEVTISIAVRIPSRLIRR